MFAQNDTTIFQDVTETHLPCISNLSASSAVGDLEKDGDLDIVLGSNPLGPGWPGQTRLYLNDGNGYYIDESFERLPSDSEVTFHLVLGDIDNDGDQDLFLANNVQGTLGGGQDNLYLNSGDGRFNDVSGRLPQIEVRSKCAAFVDVNGDNTLDLVVAQAPPQLLLNDGIGHFIDYSATHIPMGVDTLNIYKFLPADIDGDWDLDLVVVNAWNPLNLYLQHEEIWINDGSGVFTRRVDLLQSDQDNPGLDGDVFDLNSDGILDIIIAQVFQNELYLSADSGHYQNVSISHLPTNYRTSAIQFGDLNGNGLVDLVLANSTFDDQLFINTGDGFFADSSALYLPEIPQSSSRDVNIFDADNDGDLDLHFASTGDGQDRLLLNTGFVQDATPPVLHHNEEEATWQDMAGRGHLRVFVSDASRWIAKVTLVRHDNEGAIDTIVARTVGGDLYQATVDSQFAATSWQYHWFAEDRAGNQSLLPAVDEALFTWVPQPVSTIRDEPISNFQLLVSVYPNPFNPSAIIKYKLSELSEVSLIIYDISGRVVQRLVTGSQAQGYYQVIWEGTDEDGLQVAAGMYFARLQAGEYSSVVKMIYLR